MSSQAKPDLKNAVSVHVFGGLGNMLFQYMAGHALSMRLGVPLYCVSPQESDHQSTLELVGLQPSYVSVPPSLLKRAAKRRPAPIKTALHMISGQWPARPVCEPHYHYFKSFESLKPGCLLSGYWQSYRYFEQDLGHLGQIIRPAAGSDVVDERWTQWTAGFERVCSVHIRRGDYVRDAAATKVHGVLGRDYYDRAKQVMDGLAAPDRYLVFSDQPEAAARELAHWGEKAVFLPRNAQDEDLALMSRCHHHITANSSYSWWAAVLNRPQGKQVIAPRQWFSEETLRKKNTCDLMPPEWIRL
ncbi:alpha-1,2-fucosyltransferase [Roseibium litorale]|uniref:Alpha-1,2-fucosyltransferase n=1 Tax=Roseibium litorale TaxID=2803841 RepID=A0ABR9CM37_9HYPH|nr:alpha-1,2-fucosyltransferase [Roseibium litorale]MBD8891923.1 alpha-1,2-fucosyltransferase [Roseibium litorale]